jgi:hypothetical protein
MGGPATGQAARVALVFKIPLTEDSAPSLNLLMIPVAYHKDAEVERERKSVIKNISPTEHGEAVFSGANASDSNAIVVSNCQSVPSK